MFPTHDEVWNIGNTTSLGTDMTRSDEPTNAFRYITSERASAPEKAGGEMASVPVFLKSLLKIIL
jgi:hypothetical protein